MRTFIVGTRKSELALTQTGQVIDMLRQTAEQLGISCQFRMKTFVTKGDRILNVTLSKVGGKGLFVKEIEQALLEGDIDLAIHSMKDVPSELPEGLIIGAIPRRVDPRDCLVSLKYHSLQSLPQGARIGTSSLRRACQLRAFRPDLHIESIRGNIDTRLRKLETEGFDGIILAAAGLERMGWTERISEYVPVDICLPAVGQGALGIECRADDDELRALLSAINDPHTEMAVMAERSFLHRLDGGCQVPIGAYAVASNNDPLEISLTGMVGTPDGSTILQETMNGHDPQQLGKNVADLLIERGASRILANVRG